MNWTGLQFLHMTPLNGKYDPLRHQLTVTVCSAFKFNSGEQVYFSRLTVIECSVHSTDEISFSLFFFVLWDRHGTVSMFTWLRRDLSHKANVQYWPKYSLREWVVFAVCVNVSPERQTGTDIVLGRKQTQCRIIICLRSLSVTYLIGVDVTSSVLLSVVSTYKSLLM